MKKLQLILDRWMSGKFLPLFGITLALFIVFFFVIWLIWYLSGVAWSPAEAFIQLSNPSFGEHERSTGIMESIAVIITNLFGIFVLNGIILTIFVNWVSNRKDRHEKGIARYDYVFRQRYTVIIGGYKIVARLTRDLAAKEENDFIVIQTRRDPDAVRREIAAEIDDINTLRRVIIYSGDRTSWHELEELHLAGAQEIYIIGEPAHIDKSSHDSINMQTWELMNMHISDNPEKKVPCHIMFEYQSTFSAFQFTDLKLEDSRTFRFIPFSIYENWAQQVLISRDAADSSYYMPLDGVDGLPYSSPQRAHLIIAGMSKMGIALAIEAAHIAHYPNFNNPHAGRPRTLITFIDRNARREMLFFMGRFRELFQLARWRYVKAPEEIVRPADSSWDIYDSAQRIADRSNTTYRWHDPVNDTAYRSPYYGGYLGKDLIDIDFEFIEGDVSLPSIQKYIGDACADTAEKTTIAICFPIAAEALSAALYMEKNVYENAQQIWVQQAESGALVDAIRYGLTGQDSAKFRVLRPFGMTDRCDYLGRINSIMPKLVAYAYECLNNGTSLAEAYRECGDVTDIIETAKNYWLTISHDGGKSSIAKRWSNIYCANSFDTKVRSTGVDLSLKDNLSDANIISHLAKLEHNRWVMEQLLLGIRPVGKEYAGRLPIEDRQERAMLKRQNIHPDLISNDKLGTTQFYDEEIARIIPLVYHIAGQYTQNGSI